MSKGYKLLSYSPGGQLYIETECPRIGCDRPYRIDEMHSDFKRIREALDRGDRSLLRCYHRPPV